MYVCYVFGWLVGTMNKNIHNMDKFVTWGLELSRRTGSANLTGVTSSPKIIFENYILEINSVEKRLHKISLNLSVKPTKIKIL